MGSARRPSTSGTPSFGGMEDSEVRKLKALEEENGRLKRLLADAMLDNVALKDLLGKKWCRPLRIGRLQRTCSRPTG